MSSESPSTPRETTSTLLKFINALLDRHNIPSRGRNQVLADATGLDYAVIRRRMLGQNSFDGLELKALADYFGEPLMNVLGALVDEPSDPATLQLGGVSMPCSIWLGPERSSSARRGPWVAYKPEGVASWVVVPIADAGDRKTREVRRIVYENPKPRRVAVVDDDHELADTIVQFLLQKSLDAVSFPSIDKARSAIQKQPFDGYVLDWFVGDATVADLLPAIRSRCPLAPIIILTGQMKDHTSLEDELATATSLYRAQLFEKPARLVSLYSALDLGFASASRQVG